MEICYENILVISSRAEFRDWLAVHHATARECYVELQRGRPVDDGHFLVPERRGRGALFRVGGQHSSQLAVAVGAGSLLLKFGII